MRVFSNKRGQVTIFIVVSIIIVVGIVVLFYLTSLSKTEISPKDDPQGFIEECILDEVKKSTDKILPMGGFLEPDPSILFRDVDVQYLCYIEAEKKQCVVLEPMLKDHIEQEIIRDSQQKIERCFNELEKTFEGYDYFAGPTEYFVVASPSTITGTVNKEIKISKDGSVRTFNKFVSAQYSPIFDFILISNQILRKEANCKCAEEHCGADVVEISRMNQEYELELFVTGVNEKIYTIRDTKTKQEFNFALRNCILLP